MKEADEMPPVGALIVAQLDRNEDLLRQLFVELRALAALIPGAAPPPADDDDCFDDVPL